MAAVLLMSAAIPEPAMPISETQFAEYQVVMKEDIDDQHDQSTPGNDAVVANRSVKCDQGKSHRCKYDLRTPVP